MMTLNQVLLEGKEYLKQRGIADADVDAWYLLSHVFVMRRVDFFMKQQEVVEEEKYQVYKGLLKRRGEHEPLQYILQSQEFMGLEFYVDENVLIPRQETEELVALALTECEGKDVLDMCTGSGCIGISIAKLGKPRSVVAVDLSEGALHVARRNAEAQKVDVLLSQSNLFESVNQSFDVIVSNPPYIRSEEVKQLMPEVKDHEPWMALDGEEDGLYFYREIIKATKKHLRTPGKIMFEIGYDQAKEIRELLEQAEFTDIIVKKDFSGLDRIICACKR